MYPPGFDVLKEITIQRNQRGFTLMEMVTVFIIIGVLSAISVPIYRNYVRKSTLSEGRTVADSIIRGQNIYYSEFGCTVATSPAVGQASSGALGLNISRNKYFNSFSVTTSGSGEQSGFLAYITGKAEMPDSSGITITVMQVMSGHPTITDNF